MESISTFSFKNVLRSGCILPALLLLLNTQILFGQAPVITSVTPVTGVPLVATAIISGTGFNDTASRNVVYFGGATANVVAATNTSLTVMVPVGSLYCNIAVLNLTTGLSCYQNKFFTPTFDSSCYIPATRDFKARINIASGPTFHASAEVYHTAIGDIDGDGKNDLIVGCNDNISFTPLVAQSPIFVYRNIGSNGVVAYAAPVVCTASYGIRNIKLADLDRDGKLDIVAACSGSGRVSILHNLSTPGNISVSANVNLRLSSGAYEIAIGDFDGDGKPDIAAACYAVDTIEIFRNTISAPVAGPFINQGAPNGSFASTYIGFQGGGFVPISIVAADFDGDGKTDFATSNNATGDVSVFRNNTILADTFTFAAPVEFVVGTAVLQIIAADVNNDSKPDMIVCNGASNAFAVFQNTAVSGVINNLSFSSAISISTPSATVSVAGGDLNGDGKVDLVFSDNVNSRIFTYNNTTTGGAITTGTFAPGNTYSTGTHPIGITIGDLDGDTKPDIVTANNGGNSVSVFESFAIPDTNSIAGIDSICAGIPTTLTSSHCPGSYGYWAVTNSNASIVFTPGATDNVGLLTGISGGLDTVVYQVIYLSDTNFVRHVIYIKAAADTGIISGRDSFCVGATEALLETATGGRWSSTVGSIASVDTITGVVTALAPGTTTIVYTAQSLACGAASTSHPVTVNALPAASVITGPNGMCTGGSETLTVSVPGGTWLNVSPAIASDAPSGVIDALNGLTVGADTILYTTTSLFCGNYTAVKPIGVIAANTPLPVLGADSVCNGSSTTFTNGALGGSWVSLNPAVASVDPLSGVVTGLINDTTSIYYTVNYGCGPVISGKSIAVHQPPLPGLILGFDSVCSGASITLSNPTATTGGSWISSDPTIATVSPAGIVTGVSTTLATATITYSVSSFSCGTVFATQNVTVKPSPVAGAIAGLDSVCSGASVSLTNPAGTPGGAWSSLSSSIATVSPTGVVTGVSATLATTSITYTVNTFSCGSASTNFAVTVKALPNPGAITGADSVCSGASVTLTNPTAAPGGTWSSLSSAVATVSPTGVVTGVTTALTTTTISFTSTTFSCGSLSVNHPITVKPSPVAGTITGLDSLCSGASVSLANPAGTPGGAWSSLSSVIATVSPTGVVTGVSATLSTTTITYTVNTFSCGSVSTNFAVTVKALPNPGAITGADSVCSGASVTLANATGAPGGTWSSLSSAVATVSPTGVVTGVATALTTTTISFTSTTFSCGSLSVNHPFTVNPLPIAGTITGLDSVCSGASISLANPTGTPGGTWSSLSSAIASVSPTGVVTGVSATLSTTTITYSVNTFSCGSVSTNFAVTVKALPHPGAITGADSVCSGASVTLANATGAPGGTWSSLSSAVATVSPTGVVTGVATALTTTTISFTSTTFSCGSLSVNHPFTVNPLPIAGTITGLDSVCSGASVSLTNPTGTPGGTWSSLSSAIASVSATGVVTGVSATLSTTSIAYTVNTFSCGSVSTNFAVTVKALPNPGAITGADSVCSGAVVTLANTTAAPGGTWSSLSSAVASVSPTGVVTGVATALTTTTISFTSTTFSCGSLTVNHPFTVNPLPVAGTITGLDSVCSGAPVSLTNPTGTPGGTWSSLSSAIASVSATGVVTGVSATLSTTTITYTVNTFSCGSISTNFAVTVKALPNPGAITGADSVCSGASVTLANLTGAPGGTWSSLSSAVATVSPTGVVTGVATALTTTTISFTSTTFSCGSLSVNHPFTVNPLPVAGLITGLDSVCSGASISLANPTGTPGGTWSSLSSAIASVSPTGVVAGVSATLSTTTITYTVNTFSCGSVSANHAVTVKPLPNPGAITGLDSVCQGASITLTDATASGGIWSSLSSAVATVSPAGVVTGVTTALTTTTIFYTVSSFSCGSLAASHAVTVKAPPIGGTIVGLDSVCSGAATTLSNPTGTPGGVWSSLSTAIATVSPTGLVTGVSAVLATTTITYTANTFSCGSTFTVQAVTVKALPNAGTITGPHNVCYGATISLADASPGGNWTTGNSSVATVTSGGIVSGASATLSNTLISYTVPSFSCGSATATYAVTVNPYPNAGTIIGAPSVCIGSNTTMTDAIGPGSWSSSPLSIATITSSGIVHGVAAGNATITFTTTNGCGSTDALFPITVNPLASAGVITGTDTVCQGSQITLSDTTSGGSWSTSSGSIATVLGGVVGGVSGGTVDIHYTVTTGCGTAVATLTMTVNPLLPAGIITGYDTVCELALITLSDPVPGGVWSSGNTARATITTGGVVGGVLAGTVTISYAVSNACGTNYATRVVTVDPLAYAGTIVGGSNVCPGSTLSLTNSTPFGVWSSSNPAMATVGSTTGLVGGVSQGNITIYYSVTNGCGTVATPHIVQVIPLPSAGTISGPSLACPGFSVSLSETTTSGVWSSSVGSVATVDASGHLFPVSQGVTIIRYTYTNYCGSAYTIHAVTVNPLVVPAISITLSPGDTVCAGSMIVYSATAVNGGPSPTFLWTNFGGSIGTGDTLHYSPSNGDQISCTLISSAPCPIPAVVSAPTAINMIVYPVVVPVVTILSSVPHDSISFVGQSVTFNSTATYGGPGAAFQWYVNGHAISGATSSSYTSIFESSDTVYCVMMSSGFPCMTDSTDTSNVVIIIGDYLGVDNIAATFGNICVFPNPNTGNFMLKGEIKGISRRGAIHYDVMDMMGKVVYSNEAVLNGGMIDEEVHLSNSLAAGQYILRIVKDNESGFVRFMIMNQQ